MHLTGLVFRAHNPRWAFAPDSGAGAARSGGRFNAKGQPALYTSLAPATAWREAQQGFVFKAQPVTLCAYRVDCADVADLTDMAVCRELSVGAADLDCPWRMMAARKQTPPGWLMAQRLAKLGVAAIIVPSFAPGLIPSDRNVVFFRWSGRLPHKLEVIDDEERLPREKIS